MRTTTGVICTPLWYVHPVDLSVSEAASALGVSRQRIRELALSGTLPSRRVGGKAILIDRDSVERRKADVARPGRRLSERSCWAVLRSMAGDSMPELSRSERARAASRALHLSDYQPGQMRHRASEIFMRCHPGALDRLRADPRLSLSGRDAAAVHHADIVLGDNVDAYVHAALVDDVQEDFGLISARRQDANVVLRAIAYEPAQQLVSEPIVPALLLALDLIDAGDERGVRAGRALIAEARDLAGPLNA